MAAEIKIWPKQGAPNECPDPIVRPADAGLALVADALETQLGTIEAYNRLVRMAAHFKARIDAGDIKAQNPIFARNIKG